MAEVRRARAGKIPSSAARGRRPRPALSTGRRLGVLLGLALLCGGCTADRSGDAAETSTPAAPATSSPSSSPTQSSQACEDCVGIVLTGDLLVHPQLWEQAAEDAAVTGKPPLDFEPLLAGQRPYLAAGTLGICHLETPVADPQGPFSGYPQFNVPPQIVVAAKEVGYDACTTASNHSMDWGPEGVERSLAALDAAGLPHTGSYVSAADAGKALILDQPEAKVAVIEATYGLNGLVPDQPWRVDMLDAPTMIAKARAAREQGADIVVAALHAGDEYASVPNAQQTEVAHALADSGEVDFIYGHHTHSVLPIEKYNGTWIVYGLGNGVTELSPTYEVNNEGLMVRARLSRDDAGAWSVSGLDWLPSLIVAGPYRWCSLAPDQPAGACSSPEQEAAVRERTRSVVESLGAAEAGARQWELSTEGPGR
ncbi:CapA family protein [Arthrobacter burdickii]|uniref:CapA family protein n=1 Tax=Arthrobacter burdickii TaxID=3035920 RepID=A0ABT8JZR2_9MICC|nr:CapA family protein [Arthrobacter burdickii]MDN4610658.1 CapA family protein [Arthrobacter burdickii]